MRKVVLFLCGSLITAALLTGCTASRSENAAAPGNNSSAEDAEIKIGQNLTISTPDNGLSFISQNDSIAANGMYYATWAAGDAVDYENSDGDTVDLYDAQLYLLLEESANTEQTTDNLDSWLSAAEQNYDIKSSEELSINNETYTIINYICNSETSPYDHGVSAFAAHDTSAICIELTCIENYTGDLNAMMTDFLSELSWRNE